MNNTEDIHTQQFWIPNAEENIPTNQQRKIIKPNNNIELHKIVPETGCIQAVNIILKRYFDNQIIGSNMTGNLKIKLIK